ncbi:hypothetical protein AX16_010246 [Volvariella volvacea WC 439]|nr:hypothetical protein AX16_010246 [Volvariella volvacea WC 439]
MEPQESILIIEALHELRPEHHCHDINKEAVLSSLKECCDLPGASDLMAHWEWGECCREGIAERSVLEKEEDGAIFPTISEEEIMDKAKGDFLAKVVVVMQTSWFVVQCVPRHA